MVFRTLPLTGASAPEAVRLAAQMIAERAKKMVFMSVLLWLDFFPSHYSDLQGESRSTNKKFADLRDRN